MANSIWKNISIACGHVIFGWRICLCNGKFTANRLQRRYDNANSLRANCKRVTGVAIEQRGHSESDTRKWTRMQMEGAKTSQSE